MSSKDRRRDIDRALFIISTAAQLAGVHPQTLRIYERKGLLNPQRTQGNSRRYSERDVARMQAIQDLTQDGVNLAGVRLVMELQNQLERMQRELEHAKLRAIELERQIQLRASQPRYQTDLMLVRDAVRIFPLPGQRSLYRRDSKGVSRGSTRRSQ